MLVVQVSNFFKNWWWVGSSKGKFTYLLKGKFMHDSNFAIGIIVVVIVYLIVLM